MGPTETNTSLHGAAYEEANTTACCVDPIRTDPLYSGVIEFGSEYTQVMIVPRNSEKFILIHWDENYYTGYNQVKPPTTILFDANLRFLAFGYDATEKYRHMKEQQQKNCYYFENFIRNIYKKVR